MRIGTNRFTGRPNASVRRAPTNGRAQSEIISVVLLLFIVILGVTAVVVSGSTAIVESRDTAEITAAEHALVGFDADGSAVALGKSPAKRTDLGLNGNEGEMRYGDSSWMRVRVDSEVNGSTEVANVTLGAVRYEQGDTTVAAEGGGVWRSDGDGSVMVSRPEFHYRGNTLTLPIVSVDGEEGLTDSVRITRDGGPDRQYPNRTAGLSNPPDSGSVTVTIRSEYYEAWGRYFEERTNAVVSYDHAAERVTVRFIVLPERVTFDAGLIATSNTGELALAGTGAYVNSYDSSNGNYAQTNTADGLVKTAGEFSGTGDSLVDGDVESDSTVSLSGSTTINGSVYYGKSPAPDASKVTGTVHSNGSVSSVQPIDTFVETYEESYRTDNDNGATQNISSNRLSMTDSSAELDAGRYYLYDLTLDGEKLTMNTTDGDVTVVVRDYVKLKNGGNITVTGDGVARLVVRGKNDTVVSPTGLGSRSVNLHVGKGSAIHVPEEKSHQLRVYGTRHFNATIAGSNGNGNEASFDGLIYAPAGTVGSGYIYIKQGDLYGLAVSGNLTVGQYGAAHYDYGLRGKHSIDSPFATLERLHVTVHPVRVTDS